MKEINIIPKALDGTVDVPPSKSLCHRYIIAASLAEGISTISSVSESDDIKATIEAVQVLGAKVNFGNKRAEIEGSILRKKPEGIIDCRESGSTLRFAIPLGLLKGGEISFIGSGNLSSRPLDPYIDIFKEQGIYYSSPELPMKLRGKLKPGSYSLRGDISSQFLTGLMFALPALDKASGIYLTSPLESKSYVDLTIDALKDFGIEIINDNYLHFTIKGNQRYKAVDYSVEGDYSQAAFWIAAGLLGRKVKCCNLRINSKQGDKIFIDVMKACGAQIHIDVSSITAEHSELKGFNVDVSQFPDIAPILAVVAATAEGTSLITGASRLRIKESDRLKAISTELNKLGAEVYEGDDRLIIKGRKNLKGGAVDSWGDHRIAMALSIASIKCDFPVSIRNSDVVSKSYPGFYDDFVKLGGNINERNMG